MLQFCMPFQSYEPQLRPPFSALGFLRVWALGVVWVRRLRGHSGVSLGPSQPNPAPAAIRSLRRRRSRVVFGTRQHWQLQRCMLLIGTG